MLKKPDWLRISYFHNEDSRFTAGILKELDLNTVCIEAECPNCAECFSEKTATFMILGTSCSRNCTFCCVNHGPALPVDKNEPPRLAEAVARLGLKYVVITSVTRDDLPDGGAGHFADVIHAIHMTAPETIIEVLIPELYDLQKVTSESPAVISHNIETVKSLYSIVRPEADYLRSLDVLKKVKRLDSEIYTKSGIMLGLGETRNEILEVFDDLLETGCDFLTIGQYLSPSKEHLPVFEYIEPEIFTEYGKIAEQKGFRYVASAPFVRSSYKAGKALTG